MSSAGGLLEPDAYLVYGAVGAVEEDYFEELGQAGGAPTAFAVSRIVSASVFKQFSHPPSIRFLRPFSDPPPAGAQGLTLAFKFLACFRRLVEFNGAVARGFAVVFACLHD